MKKHKNIGSSLDDFLKEEGLLEESESVATKRVFVYQLEKEMEKIHLNKTELAKRMHTSRSSVNRILDPNKPSNLNLLIEAAKAVGKHLRLSIV